MGKRVFTESNVAAMCGLPADLGVSVSESGHLVYQPGVVDSIREAVSGVFPGSPKVLRGREAAECVVGAGEAASVAGLANLGAESLEVTLGAEYDDFLANPLDDWDHGTSWAVAVRDYESWSSDGRAFSTEPYKGECGADDVGEWLSGVNGAPMISYGSISGEAVVRWLRGKGARGFVWASVCSHSGEWLSWGRHGSGGRWGNGGDFLVYVSPEMIVAEDSSLELVDGRWLRAGVDVDAEVEAWAASRVDGVCEVVNDWLVWGQWVVTVEVEVELPEFRFLSASGSMGMGVAHNGDVDVYAVQDALGEACGDLELDIRELGALIL